MANTKIANAAAIDACDAMVDRIDLGATNPEGHLRIYDSTQPTGGPDEAVGAQVLLAELLMSNPAFGAAIDVAPGGEATAGAIADDTSADAAGTASWFRVVDRAEVAIFDGDVTVSAGGGDLELNSIVISAGATVAVTAYTFTMPEG